MNWQQQPLAYRTPTVVACLCGAVFPLRFGNRLDPEAVPAVQRWRDAHSGQDCGPCSAQTAGQSRRRERRAQQRAAAGSKTQ